MISLSEAKHRATELQSSGDRLLQSLNLSERLNRLGEVVLEGSYHNGLMVKPDIDYSVYTPTPDLAGVSRLAGEMIMKDNVYRIVIEDMRKKLSLPPGKPAGIYLGLRLVYEDAEWSFDIWVLRREDKLDNENFPYGWDTKLTIEMRNRILWLKYNLVDLGRYGSKGGFASADIYRAVMNDGVKTIADLDEWRKTHPYY